MVRKVRGTNGTKSPRKVRKVYGTKSLAFNSDRAPKFIGWRQLGHVSQCLTVESNTKDFTREGKDYLAQLPSRLTSDCLRLSFTLLAQQNENSFRWADY